MKRAAPGGAGEMLASVVELHRLLDGLDVGGCHDEIERLRRAHTVPEVVNGVLMPFLRNVGARWETGELSVAHEHLASQVVRAHLTDMQAESEPPSGPVVVVACPPGERHDIGALAFDVLLSEAGWRARFLGADTPVGDLALFVKQTSPDLVVLSASRETVLLGHGASIRKLAADVPVGVGGSGSSAQVADEVGATWLGPDVSTGVEIAFRIIGHQRPSIREPVAE